MVTSSNRPSASAASVVEAPTLKDALKQVRARYGEDARVIRSRTLTRRQAGGLGQEKVVEVLVEPARGGRGGPAGRPGRQTAASPQLAREIAAEVERIETLVRQMAVRQAGHEVRRRQIAANPVGEALVAAGADPGVVVRLSERCQAETGAAAGDRTALLEYVTRSFATGRGGWQDLAGTHVLLGAPGGGTTELLLRTAACLGAAGRQVVVLSVLPRHAGEVRRLQSEAAQHGYDAAVIQKPRQLAAAAAHLDRYDVVLVDGPSPAAQDDPDRRAIRQEIVENPALHRHLVFPLDRDLRDCRALFDLARAWHCDWLAVSRVDQCVRRGKLLDLVDQLPLPISLVSDPSWPAGEPRLADPGLLTELVLTAARHRDAARA